MSDFKQKHKHLKKKKNLARANRGYAENNIWTDNITHKLNYIKRNHTAVDSKNKVFGCFCCVSLTDQ